MPNFVEQPNHNSLQHDMGPYSEAAGLQGAMHLIAEPFFIDSACFDQFKD